MNFYSSEFFPFYFFLLCHSCMGLVVIRKLNGITILLVFPALSAVLTTNVIFVLFGLKIFGILLYSQRQSSNVSKKADVDGASSHQGSGAEEVPSVQTDDVVSNVRSDKHSLGRADDVVSNVRSENRCTGIMLTEVGLENIPSPGNQQPDDSSASQKSPGYSRSITQDNNDQSSREDDSGPWNYSAQASNSQALPKKSNHRESGRPITRSGQIQEPGFRSVPGHLFLVPDRTRKNTGIKEVDLHHLLFLIQMNLDHLDSILNLVLLGRIQGIDLGDVLRGRNLIIIGLTLEIPID